MGPPANKPLLIVEDDFLIGAELCRLMQDQGYDTVGPIGHIDEALDRARREMLDGAFLDLKLSHASTVPVALELRRRNVPFVVITGYGHLEAPPEVADAVIIGKPYTTQELLKAAARAFPPRNRKRM